MLMYISDHDFIHPQDYGSAVDARRRDILETIVHEMGHGLGISSAIYNNNRRDGYHGPQAFFEPADGGLTIQFGRTLYDTHVHTHDTSIKEILSPMVFSEITPHQTQQLKNDPASLGPVMAIHELLKEKNTLFFHTKGRGKVVLHTSPARSGRSVSHFDGQYSQTQNYLMARINHYHRQVLEIDKMEEDWRTAPIGGLMAAVLETLGYHPNQHPCREKSQVALFHEMLKLQHK